VNVEPQRLYEALAGAGGRDAAPAFTFLGDEPRRYTRAALFAAAEDIAKRLEDAVPRGGLLGLLLRSQEAQVLHYLAALRAGLVPAILTPPNRKLNRAYYAETTAAVLRRSAFSAVVSDLEGVELPTLTLAPVTAEATVRPADPQPPSRAVPDVALLQFSSGTTGIKRGVPLRRAHVLVQSDVYGSAIGLSPADVIVSWLPLYHDMGFIACLNMPLLHGVHTVMIDPIDWVTRPSSFLHAVSEFGGTLAWNPNFAYSFMAERVRPADLTGMDLGSLRGLVNCSEPVTHESQSRFAKRFAPHGLRRDVFWGCYAMAETTFALTHGSTVQPGALDEIGPVDGTRLRSPVQVSVGQALPGVALRVFADDGRPLPDREVGELWVRSPFNFEGYFNDPDATTAAHVDGWYRTGDLGYAVGGDIFVTGRKKDVLIVGGVNVFPQDIEAAVSEVDGVLAGRVSASSEFDAAVQSERIVILFESDVQGPELRRLTLEIRQRLLAAFQIANFAVHRVEPGWLVKSTSGKIARSANRRKWAQMTQRDATTGE
jgi:fatty-acyl-CoA synthase